MTNFINSDYNHSAGINYTGFQQNYPCTQISENDTLCLSNRNRHIKKITKVSVDFSIYSYKIIPTPIGKSLVVDAIKHITVTYVDKDYNSLVCTTFKVPFCFCISMNKIREKLKSISVSVENICVTVLNENSFSISMVVFAYPVFQQKKKSSVCNNDSFYVNPSNCKLMSNRPSNIKCNNCTCNNCHCNTESNTITIIFLFLLLNFARINLIRHL